MSEAAEKWEVIHYSYKDYLETDEDFRAEIIDGRLYVMSPPGRYHQGILGKLFIKISNFQGDKPFKVYPGPFGGNRDTIIVKGNVGVSEA
ncbi:MAG: Uma2 family endonuclease, partial [Treponema sp.]|nr:Uma2 family endonuclease [Treponema sp.]